MNQSSEEFMNEFLKEKPEPEKIAEEHPALKNPEIVTEARSTLNEEQSVLFDGLLEFIQGDGTNYAVVIGYAGTGKTYAISKFISAIKSSCAMTAPTNKAVKVLADNRTNEMHSVTFSTIHKMLGLKMQWVYPKGRQNFKPYQKLVRNYKGSFTLNDYGVLIIDEVSMLSDELFEMIHSQKSSDLKIIFLGDPAQIPPVNALDSVPLLEEGQKKYEMERFDLEKIMRQADGSKILTTSYSVRNLRFENIDPIADRTNGADVTFLSPNNDNHNALIGEKIIEAFMSQAFSNDPDFCKVIAWRNKTVDAFNTFIRCNLFDKSVEELLPIMVGEKLIADTPVIKRITDPEWGTQSGTIIFNTSDEFEVVEYQKQVYTHEIKNKAAKQQLVLDDEMVVTQGRIYTLHYYSTIVKYPLANELTVDGEQAFSNVRIDILCPESEKELGRLKSEFFYAKDWKNYELIADRFAKVKYNYAITCHKAQGSTYGTVFLIEDDIDKNQEMVERNRIKYTAISRPKTHLYVLSRRNSYK